MRARDREDLVRLLKRLGRPKTKILETQINDYPFRVWIEKQAWSRYLVRVAEALDYDNFKDEVTRRQGKERHDVYSSVWSVLHRLERRRWYEEHVRDQARLDLEDLRGDMALEIEDPEPAPPKFGGGGRRPRGSVKKRSGYNPKYPNVWESGRY